MVKELRKGGHVSGGVAAGGGTSCALSHSHSVSAWRFHLRRYLSHEWVERPESDSCINSKPWNSFWGGECDYLLGKNCDKGFGVDRDSRIWKRHTLEVAKWVFAHEDLCRF